MRKNAIFLLIFTLFFAGCSSDEKKLIGKYKSDRGIVYEIKKRKAGLISNGYTLEKVESNKWCFSGPLGEVEAGCLSPIDGGKQIRIQYTGRNSSFLAKRVE